MRLRLRGNYLFLKYNFNKEEMTLEKIESKILEVFVKQNAYKILISKNFNATTFSIFLTTQEKFDFKSLNLLVIENSTPEAKTCNETFTVSEAINKCLELGERCIENYRYSLALESTINAFIGKTNIEEKDNFIFEKILEGNSLLNKEKRRQFISESSKNLYDYSKIIKNNASLKLAGPNVYDVFNSKIIFETDQTPNKRKEDNNKLIFLNTLKGYVEIEKILKEDIDLDMKQLKLETLNCVLEKKTASINYVMPKNFVETIRALNILCNSFSANDYEDSKISNSKLNSYAPREDEVNQRFKFICLVRFMRYTKQNTGLLILHSFIESVRLITDKNFNIISTMKETPSEDFRFKKTISTQINNTFENQDFVLVGPRTDVKTLLANLFLNKSLKLFHLYEKLFYEINKEVTKFDDLRFIDNLAYDIKKYLDLEPYYNRNMEIPTVEEIIHLYKNFKLNSNEVRLLEDLLMSMLESLKVIGTVEEKEGKKQVTYSTVHPDFLATLFELNFFKPIVPDIVMPDDWILEAKAIKTIDDQDYQIKELNFGGFLSNSKKYFPGTKSFSKNSYTNISNELITALNHLQKTPYKVSEEFINHILLKDNFTDCFCNYLGHKTRKHKNYKGIFFDVLEGDRIQLYSIETIMKKMESNKKNVEFSAKELVKHILIFQSLFLSFVTILMSAYVFRKHIIFYPFKYDSRFRMYPYAHLLSPQGNALSKSLLELHVPESLETKIIESTRSNQYYELQIKDWQKTAEKDSSKSFLYRKFVNSIMHPTVTLDVSSSGFQIYSGLCGYELGLKLTNLVSENCNDKNDFYENFKSQFFIECQKAFKNDDTVLKEIENTFDRTFHKSLMVAFLYSEGSYSRRIHIENELKSKYFKYETPFYKKRLNNLSLILNKIFVDLFKELHPAVHTCMKTIQGLAKSNAVKERRGVIIKMHDTESFIETVCEETHTFRYYNHVEAKFKKYNYNVETNKYNLRKSMLSINPNFIHRLDALLLNFVVLKAKANNIPLNCAHDSFTTFVVFEKQIKAYYYEAFVKFILKDEALQNFFDTNTNFKIEEEVQNHLDMFRLEKFNILNKISSNELVMSNNILKP